MKINKLKQILKKKIIKQKNTNNNKIKINKSYKNYKKIYKNMGIYIIKCSMIYNNQILKIMKKISISNNKKCNINKIKNVCQNLDNKLMN